MVVSIELLTLDEPPPEPAVRLRPRAVAARVLVHAAWVTLLSVAVVARVGRFGFNPTDQGFILGASWRVLHGEVPHLDVISARPLGSAVLHTIDFALPAPLFLASSFVMMVELAVATIACAALLTRSSPLTWGPLRTGLVAAAALVNLHGFPLMAWHTVDGIFLVSVGWWLLDIGLRSDSAWPRRIGLFLLGFAVMCKQSFMFGVPVGVLLVFLHPARRADPRGGRWWGRLLVDLVCLGAFPLGYLGVVAAAGGLRQAVDQLTGGAGAWGGNLLDFWDSAVGPDQKAVYLLLACLVLAGAAWSLRSRLGGAGVWVRLVPTLVAAAVPLYLLHHATLGYPLLVAVPLLWVFLVTVVVTAIAYREVPWWPLAIGLLAYMASLSWGYNVPALLAGTLVLGTLDLLVRHFPDLPARLPRIAWRVVGSVLGAAALVVAGLSVAAAHDRAPYADLPQGSLTADLGDVTPTLRGVRSNPSVHTYVRQIGDCLRRYPAARVAVLPENAFVYPAFGVRNPLPMDWPVPLELIGDATSRVVAAAGDLDRAGDYLVLFETVSGRALATGAPVPAQVASDAPIVRYSGVEDAIRAELTGRPVTCGSFVGVWSPRP
ncbi:hypothetical protein [Actinokineospora sp. NBRC 105648]|uniref:hypothetical protein n=1 Tax=Actinokineospora sp. NBRC 105648 TaxID=3032206 RepID=UPI0024A1DCB9|nr:hypothetical protein [Actinokineospora sp. NBRC 105648]GLZ41247.1 hypothetical protein Acsp05_48710 [Actinokineospora sp. NBRC 105648]